MMTERFSKIIEEAFDRSLQKKELEILNDIEGAVRLGTDRRSAMIHDMVLQANSLRRARN